MRIAIAVLAVLGLSLVFTSCKGAGVSRKTELKTDKEKFSYALGLDIGKNIKHAKEELDLDLLAQGLKDRMDDEKILMDEKEIVPILQKTFAALQQKQKANMPKPAPADAEAGKKNLEAGKKFLEENAKKTGIKTTKSGLQYKVVQAGKGAKPTATDKVKVHYAGTLLNGTEFDSSIKRGQPATFPLNGVIKGWTEGIQLMDIGAKYTFYIPSELAYGANPRQGGPIGPNEVLIFEVELLEILK